MIPLKAAGVAFEGMDSVGTEFGIANVEDGRVNAKKVPVT